MVITPKYAEIIEDAFREAGYKLDKKDDEKVIFRHAKAVTLRLMRMYEDAITFDLTQDPHCSGWYSQGCGSHPSATSVIV